MISINYPLSGTKIYRFKIIGNFDGRIYSGDKLGETGDAFDKNNTKFLICEDVVEAADSDHPRHGIRYVVLRPKHLWNTTGGFSGVTDDTGDDPIYPIYDEDDEIFVIALFDESSAGATEIASNADSFWGDLVTYLSSFQTGIYNIFNWGEINDEGVLKCYFADINTDARVRGVSSITESELREIELCVNGVKKYAMVHMTEPYDTPINP